jgi:hypothetical protein
MKTQDYLGIAMLGGAAFLIWKLNQGINKVGESISNIPTDIKTLLQTPAQSAITEIQRETRTPNQTANYFYAAQPPAVKVAGDVAGSIVAEIKKLFPQSSPVNYGTTAAAQAQGVSYAQQLYSGGNPNLYGSGSLTYSQGVAQGVIITKNNPASAGAKSTVINQNIPTISHNVTVAQNTSGFQAQWVASHPYKK